MTEDPDKLREVCRDLLASMTGAAFAYRRYAGRSRNITPRGRTDPFFTTRVADMDQAVKRARILLELDT